MAAELEREIWTFGVQLKRRIREILWTDRDSAPRFFENVAVDLVEAQMWDEEADDERILESFRPALKLLARSQLGLRFRRVLDDSDIVQQTPLEDHNNREQYRGATSAECFAWLRRILTNTNLDNVRRYTRDSPRLTHN